MRHLVAALAFASLIATPALAETQEQLLNQGPPKTSQPLPDPSHIPMIFGKDIPWKGETASGRRPCLAIPTSRASMAF